MFLSSSNDKILIIEVSEVFFSSIINHQMALMMKSYAFQNHMQPRRVLLEVSLKHVFCKFASKSRYTSSAGFSTLPSQNQVLGPHLTKMCKITTFNYPFAKREKKEPCAFCTKWNKEVSTFAEMKKAIPFNLLEIDQLHTEPKFQPNWSQWLK